MASIGETRCATSDPTPMNHSNKDGKPDTESDEGRPLIEENTHPPHMHPTQSGASMSPGWASVRKAVIRFAATIRDKSRMR